MPPLISVVVPAYRCAETLPACLDSILSQSFGDIETLVVDDGSPDTVREIVEKYIAADPRVRLYSHPSNMNLFETRITGFSRARGKFITVCDADDMLPPNATLSLANAIHRHDADIIHGRAIELGGSRNGKRLRNCDPFSSTTGPAFVHAMVSVGRGWNLWGKTFKADLVRRCLGTLPRRTGWFMLEDLLFCLIFGRASKRYAGIPETVYCYRCPNNSGSVAGRLKNSFDQVEIMRWLENASTETAWESETRALTKRLFFRLLAHDIGKYGDQKEKALVLHKIAGELGPEYVRQVIRNPFSTASYLSPAYHARYVAENGTREYCRRVAAMWASAQRLGIAAVFGKLFK